MKEAAYLGVDIGSISTKGVVIGRDHSILASEYIWTEGDPVGAVKKLIRALERQLPETIQISAVGTTGSARKLIGSMLNASIVKNEITAHAVGTLSKYPDTKTILEIGGQDSKIILIDNGIVTDYAMNTLCAAGTGAFLTSQAKRLGIPIEDIGDIALRSENPVKIAARCTVFAESDMIHKAQIGNSKEDLVAGLCKAIASNYLNNVGKGKNIRPPILFQGGVSKNKGVIKAFEQNLKMEIKVDENAHLMGAIGVAILSKTAPEKDRFCFDIIDMDFLTKGYECEKCSNHCEIITFYKNNTLIDAWGNRCPNGLS